MDAAAALVREFGLWGASMVVLLGVILLALPAVLLDWRRRSQFRLLETRLNSQIETNRLNAETEKLKIENEHDRRSHEMQLKLQEAILQINRTADERFEQARKELEKKDRELLQLRQDNARHVELRAQAETQAQERQSMIETLMTDLRTTNEKLLETTKKLGKYENLEQRLQDMRQALERLQTELTHAQEANKTLTMERTTLVQRNAILEQENGFLRQREQKLHEELDSLRNQVTELTQRVEHLERENRDLLQAQKEEQSSENNLEAV